MNVHTAGFTSADGPVEMPFVFCDMSERPDVRDLNRVLNLECRDAFSQMYARWTYGKRAGRESVTLDIDITSPVRCSFTVVFDVKAYAKALLSIWAAGQFVVVHRKADDPEGDSIGWDSALTLSEVSTGLMTVFRQSPTMRKYLTRL